VGGSAVGVAPPSGDAEGTREGVTAAVKLFTPGVYVWQTVMVGAKWVEVDCILPVGVDELEGFEDMEGIGEADTVPSIPGVPVLSGEGEVEVVEEVEGQGDTVAAPKGEGVKPGEMEAGRIEKDDAVECEG